MNSNETQFSVSEESVSLAAAGRDAPSLADVLLIRRQAFDEAIAALIEARNRQYRIGVRNGIDAAVVIVSNLREEA